MTDDENDTKLAPGELSRFAQAFSELVGEARNMVRSESGFVGIVADHLGVAPSELPAVVETLDMVERPNLQLALNAMMENDDRSRVVGLSQEVGRYQDFSIASLLTGAFRGPGEPVPPVFDALPIDVDETLPCVSACIWLLWHDGHPVVVGAFAVEHRGPSGKRVEVFAADPEVARAVAEELARLRRKLNVYRHKVLSFAFSEYGGFGIAFLQRPTTAADEVVLPAADLKSIEGHTLGIAAQAEALRERGQHLKRGLLLYGPPGTGKTHTISYLMAAMPLRTTLILQGPGVGALGQAAAIARAFPPAMVVIEDVDLVASERGMPGMQGTNPLMFQLLNEMDGLVASDDVLFVLTTNRLDMLEPALAARPGRIDHAVEIARPNAAGRAQLLRLYLGPAADSLGDMQDLVDRSEGVTASFFEELVRRANIIAIEDDNQPIGVTHLDNALTELLDHAAPVMQAMLGSGRSEDDGPPRPGPPGMVYAVRPPHA